LFFFGKTFGVGIRIMEKSVENVPFRDLSLEERVKVVKEYVLSREKVLMQDLYNYFGCSHETMGEVVCEAGFCLLPRSWHSANKVLRAYRDVGRDYEKLCEKTGLGYRSVFRYLEELGILDKEKKNKEDKVLRAYKEGYRTCSEIAEVAGISPKKVFYCKKKLGLPSEKKGRPMGSKGKSVNRRRNGLVLSGEHSIIEIAKIEGVTKQEISEYIIRHDLREDYRRARIEGGHKVYGSD